MKRVLTIAFLAGAILVLADATSRPAAAAESRQLLWQIGQPDRDDREFSLAPNRYGQFKEDGFFIVGRSEPLRDWPYVHPGPAHGWAGARQHTFTIVFGLEASTSDGECRLRLGFVDTQSKSPAALRLTVNGIVLRVSTDREAFRLPAGAGDASVFGEPGKGRAHQLEVPFPARLLQAGANEVAITTISGSWALYDWLGLETPPILRLTDVHGNVVRAILA